MLVFQICCILFVFTVVLFLLITRRYLNKMCVYTKIHTGWILDQKVDEIFMKSTALGEVHSRAKAKDELEQISLAYERSMAIASDVLLQNGINPREYNLYGMVMLSRMKLGMKIYPKGGDISGKSERSSVQY